MWALIGLKRLIAANYAFSETEKTRAELDRYRIESNSVLSFAKMYCQQAENGVVVRDDLFLRYKGVLRQCRDEAGITDQLQQRAGSRIPGDYARAG